MVKYYVIGPFGIVADKDECGYAFYYLLTQKSIKIGGYDK